MAKVFIVVLIVVLAGGYFFWKSQTPDQKMVPPTQTGVEDSPAPSPQKPAFNFSDFTVTLNNQEIIFKNGHYISSNPDEGQHSADVSNLAIAPSGTTSAVLLVDSPSGSGTFYYLLGAMKVNDKVIYSQPILLGDRIQFQKMNVVDPEAHDNGEIILTYLEHGPNDPMAGEPTKQVEKKFSFEDSGDLMEVLH